MRAFYYMRLARSLLLEQTADFLLAEFTEEGAARLNHLVDEVFLLGLQSVDFLLNCVLGDELHDLYLVLLSQAVGAVGSLVLYRGVPPRVEMDNHIGPCEVQPRAARLERDEKNRRAPSVKGLDEREPLLDRCTAIEVR